MKLVDLSITEFAKVLGSDAPAPGGGSAAALSAANGISLTKMVCELTIGKKKYAEFEDHIKGVHEKSAQLQDQLLEAIDKDTEAFNVVSAVFDLPKETEEEKEPEVQPRFTVDFATLQQMNPDTVGWIRFEEPSEISYPVVKGRDNEEYLTRTFEANDNKLGTLFVDKDNTGTFTDRNTIIYGHNMKNGTMFAQLLKYKEQDFFEKYPYFSIYTPDGKESKYQIFVAGVVEDTAVNYQFAFQSDEEFLNYIETVKGTSLYTPNVEIDAASQIVTLSTCTNVADEERFVVQAVKVSEQ